MMIRHAKITDKEIVLKLLDEFRSDCAEQITGEYVESHTAREGGRLLYESLLSRNDYGIFLLVDLHSKVVGVITGYLCPMLRNGGVRAEVEEFFVQKEHRGNGNAKKLMDAFFAWCKMNQVRKVNLESENKLNRAHSFYKKYGFETKAQRFIKKLES
ncbi:MAG: GNAT family N-acetyltransferase [Candidatus Pacebacteria bacterium]|nr:GNAT family N-acetyltransferase [Candidatus Paceibacterota bacterium]